LEANTAWIRHAVGIKVLPSERLHCALIGEHDHLLYLAVLRVLCGYACIGDISADAGAYGAAASSRFLETYWPTAQQCNGQ